MGDMLTPQYAPRRVMGDPGKAEQFLFPHYVYFVFLKQVGENWTTWKIETRTVQDEDWKPMRYAGSLRTAGDSIYQYTEQIHMITDNQHFNGRIYAVASAVPLTFNRSFDASHITNLDQTLGLTFDVSADSVSRYLQHIYSTPYNYDVSGAYYGSFSTITSKVPHVNLLLYHVAAKVDIKWNVQEDKRIDRETPDNGVRLTYMETRNLFNGFAYCFKPMRNTLSALPSSGYAITNIVTPSDEGLWWEGRTYFYTIPYTVTGEPDYFPLQLVMCTNDTPKENGYKLTLKQPIDTSDVFVPWLRGDFNLTKPLENKSETKIAGI